MIGSLFRFGSGFDATGANSLSVAVNFFGLQVDLKSSKRFDLGMADLVSGLAPASANIAYSRHIVFLRITNKYECTNNLSEYCL